MGRRKGPVEGLEMNHKFWSGKRVFITGHTGFKGGWLALWLNKMGAEIYGYSLAAILFFHMIVNIGMVIGLFPTVGIPLPFFSYGGSSLWGFTILLFIFIRLDAHKHYDW